MARSTVSSPGAPSAVGPYSQSVLVDGWLWCSGQIPLDPETNELVGEGDDDAAARTQTRRVLRNLSSVVEAAGGSFDDVVRCTVYLTNLDDYAAVNEVYAQFFAGDSPPSRACVEVSRLPKGVLVEISCVARIG